MDVKLASPPVGWWKHETPELNRYLDEFMQMRAGRVFNWENQSPRWRNAMNLLCRLHFEWTEQGRQAAQRANVAAAVAWGHRP